MKLSSVLLKLAFGPGEAKIINKLFRQHVPKKIRSSGLGTKGGGGQFSAPKRGGRFIGQMDYTAAMNERESKALLGKLNTLAPGQSSRPLRKLRGDISSRLVDMPAMPEAPELRVDPGAYETSIRSGANRFIQRTGAPKDTMLRPLSPRQGKMLNTIIQGHELNERSGMLGREPSLITQRMAHTDTDVVLRESNMAHDVGERRGYKQVKDYLTANAEMGPEQQRLFRDIDPRLGYGEQKLNRSARKHIKRIADRKYIEAMSEPGFTMKDYEGDIYKGKFGSLAQSLLKLAGGPLNAKGQNRRMAEDEGMAPKAPPPPAETAPGEAYFRAPSGATMPMHTAGMSLGVKDLAKYWASGMKKLPTDDLAVQVKDVPAPALTPEQQDAKRNNDAMWASTKVIKEPPLQVAATTDARRPAH